MEVNLCALRDLTGGDAEFERDLIQTFIASGDACLADIVTALAAQDLATIGNRAHALKGASANIHAAGLAAAASTLERVARGRTVGDLPRLVADLADKLKAVNAELSQVG